MSDALPTREEIAYQFKCVAFGQPQMGVDWSNPGNQRWLDAADALLARLRPAWEAKDKEISAKAQVYWEQCARDVDALRADLTRTQANLRAARASVMADLALARAEIDKLAPTVLALDEEQIRLKADLRACAEALGRTGSLLRALESTLDHSGAMNATQLARRDQYLAVRTDVDITLARPGVQAVREEPR